MFGGRHLLCAFAQGLVLLCSSAWADPIDTKSQGLAHYMMAVYDDLNGQSAQATSEYQQSIKFDPAQTAPRLKLGADYIRAGQFNKAIVQLKEAAHLSPQESRAHYLLAMIYAAQHNDDLAASEYEVVLKNAGRDDPSNADAFLYLGQLYYAEGKLPQAIEQLLKLVQLEPASPTGFFLLGSVYAESHEQPKAIDAFREVLRIDPENSEALNSLGYTYAEAGIHLDEAVRMVGRALEIDPANGAYWDSLGWAFYKKGMLPQALAALQKAESYIADKVLDDHIGDVYKAMKQYPLARQYWNKSLSLDAKQVLVRQKIKDLEKCIASQSSHQLN